jgi:bla regulator protein BlaR1
VIPHLLESTVFTSAVWLVTLALRRNQARTRHALWMAASVKFLIPFSLFVTLGGQIVRREAARFHHRRCDS